VLPVAAPDSAAQPYPIVNHRTQGEIMYIGGGALVLILIIVVVVLVMRR
jgi:hypothetical protein